MSQEPTDIAAGLREQCECPEDSECYFCEAADEIEGLRQEVRLWRCISERFAESDPRFDAFRVYFRAVRGE